MVKRSKVQELHDSSDEDDDLPPMEIQTKTTRRGPRFVARPPVPAMTPTATPSPKKRRRELSPDDYDGGGYMDEPDLPPIDLGNEGPAIETRGSTADQNDVLRDYLFNRDNVLSFILASEALPPNTLCEECGKEDGDSIALYRCLSCMGHPRFCYSCCHKVHHREPFHKIQEYRDGFYQTIPMRNVGFRIHLGHHGEECPEDRGEGLLSPDFRYFQEEELVFVDSTGVYTHPVRWCNCHDRLSKPFQLIQSGYFPGTWRSPQTAFTFSVLDCFYLDVMECNVAAMSVFQKLRRLSDNVDPDSIPNRYRELMTASRAWNDINVMKRSGFGHDSDERPGDGDLALFCSICSQPGVNIPDDFEDDPQQFKYRRRINPDGNMKAQHNKMRRPERDVYIRDGEGFLVRVAPYEAHLAAAHDYKEKCTCNHHKAVSQANSNSKNLEVTGIGICACARHGCFFPHSCVDFQKGEQQKNMDYSIVNAMNYKSNGIVEQQVIYDIACQWGVKFMERVDQSPYLSVPDNMQLSLAVGKFHLGAHIIECFYKHSLNFTEGTGQVDGEIIETLWSRLNKVSPSTRAMTKPHRREVLDDFMRDSNWKKLTGSIKMLVRKWETCKKDLVESRVGFEELSSSLNQADLDNWAMEERTALDQGGNALAIYGVKHEEAPTLAEIRLKLAENEETEGVESGVTSWLSNGIHIEEAQIKLLHAVRAMGQHGTLAEQIVIQERRRKLKQRITKFHRQADAYYSLAKDNALPEEEEEEEEDEGLEVDVDVQELDEGEEEEEVKAESIQLRMPYDVVGPNNTSDHLQKLVDQELQLRKGQANDALRQLRLLVGHKSLVYEERVREADSTTTRTRAFGAIKNLQDKLQDQAQIYRSTRSAMVTLGASEEMLKVYQMLEEKDLSISKDTLKKAAARTGQRNDILSWIWRLDGQNASDDDDWMQEFYRVNWLRAKARLARWTEEEIILRTEMDSSIRWHKHQMRVWLARVTTASLCGLPGHEAYAKKQAHLWGRQLQRAKDAFNPLLEEQI